jgi:pimeloyl-ACP methyl ester carboxylesterase
MRQNTHGGHLVSDPDRRRFLSAAAATLAARQLGFLTVPRRLEAMTVTTATPTDVAAQTGAAPTDIRPYHVSFPDSDLADLRRRIKATRWPDKELVADPTQGVQYDTMQKLATYWANDYDWRPFETRFNKLPQFVTEIDGVEIHFIHVRSNEKNALPMIVTHGWPGSEIEQLKIIEPLTNPTAHGGTAADAFDLVIPSIPGYGFSGKPTALGWDPTRIAKAWFVLMKRLGYNKFVAQGGDWGAAIVTAMAFQNQPELLAIHTNMSGTVPPDISKLLAANSPPPSTLAPDELRAYKQLAFFYTKGLGYANEMTLLPQTLYGIADSPIGLAAWILDHDDASYKLIARVFNGQTEGLSRTDILDNITMYWLTNTAVSSSRLYWENGLTAKGGFFDVAGVTSPVAVTASPTEIYTAPRSWAERAYPKLIYYNLVDKGGHFLAWEQPAIFVSEVRQGFKSLRTNT